MSEPVPGERILRSPYRPARVSQVPLRTHRLTDGLLI